MGKEKYPDIKKFFPTIDYESLQAFNTVYDEISILPSISICEGQTTENVIIKQVIDYCQFFEILSIQPSEKAKILNNHEEIEFKDYKTILRENDNAKKNAKIFNRYLDSYINSIANFDERYKITPDIKKIMPDISEDGIRAFNVVYEYYVKTKIKNETIHKILFSDRNNFGVKYPDSEIELINEIILFYKKYLTLKEHIPFTYKEIVRFEKNAKIFNEDYISYLYPIMVMPFWKAEYIKRNYFNKIRNNSSNIPDIEEFSILSDWRKQKEELIHNNGFHTDCDMGNCYFKKKEMSPLINLRHPFFYNSDCKPVFQNLFDCRSGCPFKTDILFFVLALHNERFPDFLDRINDYRTQVFEVLNIYKEKIKLFKASTIKKLEVLHRISFETGLLVFDLFGLTSPEKLLQDSCNNKTQITEEILKLPMPEFFLKSDSSNHEDRQSIYDRLYDPSNMTVVKKGLNLEAIDLSLMKNTLKGFELIIGLEGDITNDSFSIKKELDRIEKNLMKFDGSNNSADLLDFQYQHIVFGFNPSAPQFKKRINKYIEDVELIINSYRTCLTSFQIQISQYQSELRKIHNRIYYVKNYYNVDNHRAIGLLIWDQVNFLNKKPREAIHDFIESELFQKIKKMSESEIAIRKNETQNHYKYNIGTQKDYKATKKLYDQACVCIEKSDVLTESECNNLRYPKLRQTRKKQLQMQKESRKLSTDD